MTTEGSKTKLKIIGTLRGTDQEHTRLLEEAFKAKLKLSQYMRVKLGLPAVPGTEDKEEQNERQADVSQ